MTTPARDQVCPRCGQLVAMTQAGSHKAHKAQGMPCLPKTRCPRCGEVVWISTAGKIKSHKRWSGHLGALEKCPGTGS